MRFVIFAVLIGIVTPGVSFGQIDIARIRRGTDSMSISIVRGSTPTLVGELWDTFTDTHFATIPALRRVYQTRNEVFGPHLETTVVRVPQLTLLYSRTQTQYGGDSLVRIGDSVMGWREVPNRGRLIVSRRLTPTAIDGSFFDAMIRASPLDSGYALEANSYTGLQDTSSILRAQVTGSATIRQRDIAVGGNLGSRDGFCWAL